jgi:hypothetical protein
MIVSLYAGGTTVRNIQRHLARTLGIELSQPMAKTRVANRDFPRCCSFGQRARPAFESRSSGVFLRRTTPFLMRRPCLCSAPDPTFPTVADEWPRLSCLGGPRHTDCPTANGAYGSSLNNCSCPTDWSGCNMRKCPRRAPADRSRPVWDLFTTSISRHYRPAAEGQAGPSPREANARSSARAQDPLQRTLLGIMWVIEDHRAASGSHNARYAR